MALPLRVLALLVFPKTGEGGTAFAVTDEDDFLFFLFRFNFPEHSASAAAEG